MISSKTLIIPIAILSILILLGTGYLAKDKLNSVKPVSMELQSMREEDKNNSADLTLEKAIAIANKSECGGDGYILTNKSNYNSNSKTWWIDMEPVPTKPGCSPACVVSEETKTAEINWRCTGLTEPEKPPTETVAVSTEDQIKEAFAQKYGKAVDEVTVIISKSDDNHAAGSVSFSPGGVGEEGMFLAAKVSNAWQIVYDGNGSVDCDNISTYNFPQNMLQNFCD